MYKRQVSPYAPQTNADVRGDPLHPPHPTPHAIGVTHVSAYCLHTSAEIHRYDIRIAICTMATDGSRLPHPKSRYAPSMRRRRKFVRPPRSRQIRVCCSCGVVWVVKGGGGLPVHRHSYRGHRVELWRISDWLQNDKKKKVESQAYSGKPALYPAKTDTTRYPPTIGLVGRAFYLILVCTFFRHQTDQMYLFLAAAHRTKRKSQCHCNSVCINASAACCTLPTHLPCSIAVARRGLSLIHI